ncbi:hypothetical protein VitviT2T_022807 [Vitis vinifera]|uniref:Uncharacterized protein n=1 Tax=Vitis vinifera TaxID=29760 RepID=A0ABY9DCV8_VITVI|nr:hypothetical protein VitviT2T_022807 [Vitis vinifera]
MICNLIRSLEVISQHGSQRRVDFTEERHFRSPFRSCEMRVEGCEMALVCQGVVSQLRNHLRNGGLAAKFPLNFARLSSNGHNFFVSTPIHAPFEVLDF